MIHLPGHGIFAPANFQLAGHRLEPGLVLLVPQVAQKARHALFQAGEQVGKAGRILGQKALCVFVHQKAGKVRHGVVVQREKRRQPGAGVVRGRVRVQCHLQHPVHQGAALVCGKLCPLAGLQAQHILQKVAVPAGIVFFQLAGRDAQFAAQQRFQRGQVVHLPGRVFFHAAQQGKAPWFFPCRGVQRFGQAGAFDVRERPAAAQRIQTVSRRGGQIRKFQFRGRRVQRVHDGLQRRAQGLPLPLWPAEPQPLCRGGEGLIKAHLLTHYAVLEAVRQVDLLCHQHVTVGVGQKARLGRRTGELALRKAQHEHIIRCIQTHFAGACEHHGVQRLGDVPEVGRAQQQAEQVFVFWDGDALPTQQVGHLV